LQPGANAVNITATDASNAVTSKTANVTIGGASIAALTYDKAGNLVDDGTRTYLWDAANRLVQINYTGQGQAKTEITYDGRGRRTQMVEKDTSGNATSVKRFVWEGLNMAEERSSTNVVIQQFFAQGEKESGSVILYRLDHLEAFVS
jgi:YD repeat-containing protein